MADEKKLSKEVTREQEILLQAHLYSEEARENRRKLVNGTIQEATFVSGDQHKQVPKSLEEILELYDSAVELGGKDERIGAKLQSLIDKLDNKSPRNVSLREVVTHFDHLRGISRFRYVTDNMIGDFGREEAVRRNPFRSLRSFVYSMFVLVDIVSLGALAIPTFVFPLMPLYTFITITVLVLLASVMICRWISPVRNEFGAFHTPLFWSRSVVLYAPAWFFPIKLTPTDLAEAEILKEVVDLLKIYRSGLDSLEKNWPEDVEAEPKVEEQKAPQVSPKEVKSGKLEVDSRDGQAIQPLDADDGKTSSPRDLTDFFQQPTLPPDTTDNNENRRVEEAVMQNV